MWWLNSCSRSLVEGNESGLATKAECLRPIYPAHTIRVYNVTHKAHIYCLYAWEHTMANYSMCVYQAIQFFFGADPGQTNLGDFSKNPVCTEFLTWKSVWKPFFTLVLSGHPDFSGRLGMLRACVHESFVCNLFYTFFLCSLSLCYTQNILPVSRER